MPLLRVSYVAYTLKQNCTRIAPVLAIRFLLLWRLLTLFSSFVLVLFQ